MKKLLYILLFASVLAVPYSCTKTDDFLDKKPLGEYSEVDVWTDPNLVQPFVNMMYRNALGFPFAIERLSDFSDESFFTPDWDVTNFNKSLMTVDDLLGWDVDWGDIDPTSHTRHFLWNRMYANVRRANIFFAKIGGVEGDQAVIDDLKGQAYFLRAWTYFYLTNMYGGVPIITKVYSLNDEFEVERDSYEKCIDFIVSQCDSAAMHLSDTYATEGHITKGAAVALQRAGRGEGEAEGQGGAATAMAVARLLHGALPLGPLAGVPRSAAGPPGRDGGGSGPRCC